MRKGFVANQPVDSPWNRGVNKAPRPVKEMKTIKPNDPSFPSYSSPVVGTSPYSLPALEIMPLCPPAFRFAPLITGPDDGSSPLLSSPLPPLET